MLSLQDISAQYPEFLRKFTNHLLREYLQVKILGIVFNSVFASKLSFFGGTALRLIYGNTRFSEDLDFDHFGLQREEFDTLAKKVQIGLEENGFKTRITTVSKGAYRCHVRFPGVLFLQKLSPHPEENILIHIDSASHGFSYRPDKKALNKFDVVSEIFVTPPDILLSQKIAAALGRKRAKGRDFYDIIYLLSFTKPNYGYLQQKLNITDPDILRQKLIHHVKTLDLKHLGYDVQKFLFNPNDTQKIELFPKLIAEARL